MHSEPLPQLWQTAPQRDRCLQNTTQLEKGVIRHYQVMGLSDEVVHGFADHLLSDNETTNKKASLDNKRDLSSIVQSHWLRDKESNLL